MKSPDEAGARAYAKEFLAQLSSRYDELFTKKGGHWYRKEMIQEQLGIHLVDGAYYVPFIPASLLRGMAAEDKAAFDLMVQIIQTNADADADAPLPIGWDDLPDAIKSGNMQRPKRRGKTGAELGVRDLIFNLMVDHLMDNFGLPLGRNDDTRSSNKPTTACTIIYDVFRDAGLPVPDDRSIEKAVRRCEDVDLFSHIGS